MASHKDTHNAGDQAKAHGPQPGQPAGSGQPPQRFEHGVSSDQGHPAEPGSPGTPKTAQAHLQDVGCPEVEAQQLAALGVSPDQAAKVASLAQSGGVSFNWNSFTQFVMNDGIPFVMKLISLFQETAPAFGSGKAQPFGSAKPPQPPPQSPQMTQPAQPPPHSSQDAHPSNR